MGRRVEQIVVPAWGGRDDGKTFQLTEQDAVAAEKWGWRMYLATKGTAGNIPDEVAQLGMVGVAIRGINAFLAAPMRFDELEPLLDELLACVRIIRDPRHPDVATAITPGDIEEIKTVAWLRSEVLRVHTGFSFADALSSLISMLGTAPASPTT